MQPTTPTPSRQLRRQRRPSRGAFTLIEILVVVAIIIILAGATVAVGLQVKRSSQKKLAVQMLTSLDGAMKAAINTEGAREPAIASDPNGTVLWVAVLQNSPSGKAALSNYPTGTAPPILGHTTTILDPWNNPIRYVSSVPAAKKDGLFWSSGPDGIFGPDPASGRIDDVYSSNP